MNGTFTIKEILNSTYHSRYKNRFEYNVRDVLKTVVLIKETTLHPDSKTAPTVNYIFRSYSYPQYMPYLKLTKYSKQRKVKHQYDQILTIAADEDGSFSVNSVNWKYRLGSQKKWVDHPPQNKVKTIYSETSQKWKLEYEKEVEKINKLKGKEKEKQLKILKEKYTKKKSNHKKSAPYLDIGDFNSQVNGINGDFYFRCQSCYQYYNHLYGRNTAPDYDNELEHPFLPKHLIGLISALLKIGVLHE